MATIILGLDPGLTATGWGVVRAAGSELSFLGAGTIATDAAAPLAGRLAALFAALEGVVTELIPHEAAVEETFVSKDAAGSLKLGQARGIALLVPARAGLPVAEYAATQVKKTVVGNGRADKRQIRAMVGVLLPGAKACSEHAFDALAVAICHASQRRAAASVARTRVAA